MINWIEWQFWSWKSSTATYLAKQQAILSINKIKKWKSSSFNTIILSNIKMDEFKLTNYVYFEDDKFLDVLRTCNAINDLERHLYWYLKEWNSLIKWKRKKFTKFYIFFDEVWAIMNNRNYKDFNTTISEYINQNRKNFQEIYLITADWQQSDKSLRRFVDWWYYVKPLFPFPILRDIAIVRRMKKDDEGKPALQNYVWKDQNWDYITKTKPIDEYYTWYWKPSIWPYYDDLHKNIRDVDKYKSIDPNLLNWIIEKKSELLNPFNTTNKFNELKNYVKLDIKPSLQEDNKKIALFKKNIE